MYKEFWCGNSNLGNFLEDSDLLIFEKKKLVTIHAHVGIDCINR